MKTSIPVISGQLDLFSYALFEANMQAVGKKLTKEEEVLAEKDSYLKKGERLVTLAKEHLNKVRKEFSIGKLQYDLYSLSLQPEKATLKECFVKIRQFAGKYLRLIKEDGDEACIAIKEITGVHVTVRLAPDKDQLVYCVKRKKSGERDYAILLEIWDGEEKVHSAYSIKNHVFPMGRRIWMYDGIVVEDARSIIAYCILYHAVEQMISASNSSLKDRFIRTVTEAISIPDLENYMVSFICSRFLIEGLKYEISQKIIRKAAELCKEGNRNRLSCLTSADDPASPFFVDLLMRCGITVVKMQENSAMLRQKRRSEILKILHGDLQPENISQIQAEQILDIPFLITRKDIIDSGLLWKEWDYFLSVYHVIPDFKHTFLRELRFRGEAVQESRTGFLSGQSVLSQDIRVVWLLEAFKILYSIHHDVIAQIKDYENSTGSYAKSYQDKANIPAKTLQSMEASLLNKYFGYVEYDEDVDLLKVGEIEKEFLAVHETFLYGIDSQKNAIRFRKLGHHKASGLYYPGVKCLCVDFRHPESFLHEYGHLIDYEYGGLSLKGEFVHIINLYTSHLTMKMKDSQVKERFAGSEKYNLSYYSKPTEIFARCFELYCRKVLMIDNDLLPDSFEEMIYPADDGFLQAVTEYFNGLLQKKRYINLESEVV